MNTSAFLFWLASYPRSGNTWLRLLVASCLAGGTPVDINRFKFAEMRARTRLLFDDAIGVASASLDTETILRWRAEAIRTWAAELDAACHIKTHDARTRSGDGGAVLIPAEVTRGAVYLVRDPRDVAISLARFLKIDVDRAIDLMGKPESMADLSGDRMRPLLPDYWSSWSHNVESWLDWHEIAPRLVRYEDLRREPEGVLADILTALGLSFPQGTIRAAVAAVDLGVLQDQERRSGFVEAPPRVRFFGAGAVGGWRDTLTPEQAQRIVDDHGRVMRRVGYDA